MNRRYIANIDQRFEWSAPSLPTAAPTLAIPALAVSQAMTVIAAQKTITAVDGTQTDLTVSAAVGAGLTGPRFPVLVDLGSQGRFVRYIEAVINDTTVRLNEPLGLTQSVVVNPGASTMTLNWLTYGTEIAAATWTNVVQRRLAWSVSWTEDRGAAADLVRPPARGLLDVVRHVPDTGLTHAGVVAVYPHLSGLLPQGHPDLSAAIARALLKLEGWVAQQLPAGRYLDQVDFTQWHGVHLELTAATVLRDWAMTQRRDEGTAAQIKDAETQAGKAFSREKTLRWVDADDDGVRDDGEANLRPTPYAVSIQKSADVAADSTDEFDVRNPAELFY